MINWADIRERFEHALILEPPDRSAYLAKLHADAPDLAPRVEEMLAWHASADGFLEPAESVASARWPAAGGRLGPYRLLEPIGAGGMGTVYRAERADDVYDKVVAVKVLRAGQSSPEAMMRFRAERRILADLEHPNIARLLDGGEHDGVLYLAMEHVEGESIDTYAAQHALDLEARLRLVLAVCDAVRIAHQNLVVHRDLKPSNVLVTRDGRPKLLDFGIAKLLDPGARETDLAATVGSGPLTPAYASPEQLEGRPITALVDVHALGMLLYELVAGRHPFADAAHSVGAMADAVRATTPLPPSSVPRSAAALAGNRRLADDLDAIVGKAMRKDSAARYASVEALAADLRRAIGGFPVHARPISWVERVGRFVGRNRLAVTAWSAAAIVLLVVLVVLVVQRADLLDQRQRLVHERNRAQTTADLLGDIFAAPDPAHARGRELSALGLLDRGVREVGWRLRAQPSVRADLLATIATSYLGLGAYAQARELLEEVLADDRRDGDDRRVAATLHRLAEVASLEGDYDAAGALAREALTLRRRSDTSERIAESLLRLARIGEQRGDFASAEAHFEEAVALARREGSMPILARALSRYGYLHKRLGRLEAAESALREATVVARGAWGENHPEQALALGDLALVLEARGEVDEAARLLRRAEAIQRRIFDGDHPHLATTLNNLGLVAAARGRIDEAESFYAQAIDMSQSVLPPDHPRLAARLHNLADLRVQAGRWEEAEALYRQALDMRRAVLGEADADTAATRNNLARALLAAGKHADAEAMYREALAASRAALGDEHPQVGIVLNNLARARQQAGDLEAAESLYREAIGVQRRALGDDHVEVGVALYNLGNLQIEHGDRARARRTLETAVNRLEAALGPDHLRVAKARLGLALLLLDLGEDTTARDLASRARAVFERDLSEDDPWRRRAAELLDG